MHQKSEQTLNKVYKKNCVPEFPEYMNTYLLIEGTNFKAFLKENYAIALDSCYLFTYHMLNREMKMILIVLMEFAYITHS